MSNLDNDEEFDKKRAQVVDPIDARRAKEDQWIRIQTKTFTRWCNLYLSERLLKIDNIATDFADGINLINLLEEISSKSIPTHHKKPKFRVMKLENLGGCFKFLKEEGIKLVSIGPEDILDCNQKLILGLIWTIILRFQIQRGGGGSAKHELLEWVRKQIPEYDINNFKRDWQDGKAIMALAESVEPGTFDLNNEMTDDPYTNANLTFNRAEDELKIPQLLEPEDMISENPDEHANMTYIAMYRDYVENRKKRMADEELAKITVPANCKVYGPGVEDEQESGIETEFYIEAINKFNKSVNHGGDNFAVTIKCQGQEYPVDIVDNEDGTYVVKYCPKKAGTYVISVNLDNKNCGKSPFRVQCHSAVVDPSKTEVYGKGVEDIEVGEDAPFKIQSINRIGNPIDTGRTPYNVNVTGPYGQVPVDFKDNGDGTYDCNYLPTDVGDYVVEVTLDDQQVANSPYNITANPPMYLAYSKTTYAEGRGLIEGNTSEVSQFNIFTLNFSGEKIECDIDLFTVDIINPEGNLVEPNISLCEDKMGLDVSFQPELEGEYTINSLLHNKFNPLYYDHIVNSPVSVNIEAGTTASECIAYGPGLEDGIVDNEPTYFTIQAKDRKGDNLEKGGDDFSVGIKDENGNEVPFDFTDNEDGTYTVNYSPDSPGEYNINVDLKGEPIKDAPFTVKVKAGIDHGFSIVDTYSFVIQAKDKRGENVEEGGADFKVEISGPNGDIPSEKITVDDLNSGRYCVTYSLADGEGEYSVSILLKGNHIKGSPFKQIF